MNHEWLVALMGSLWCWFLFFGVYQRWRWFVDPPNWTLWFLWGPAVLRTFLDPEHTRFTLLIVTGLPAVAMGLSAIYLDFW
jgi:hypothetical protein